jgi:hypothetical protein
LANGYSENYTIKTSNWYTQDGGISAVKSQIFNTTSDKQYKIYTIRIIGIPKILKAAV